MCASFAQASKFDLMVGVARSVKTSATTDSLSDLLVKPDANDNDSSSATKKVNNSGQPQESDLARPIGMNSQKDGKGTILKQSVD
jgi:hypothetical protein